MVKSFGRIMQSVLAIAFVSAALPVLALECSYKFDAVSTTAFGNLPVGTPLSANTEFRVGASFAQEDGVLAHVAEGQLRLSADGEEGIKAETRAFNVARTSRMLDYYAIEARIVSGSLGGIGIFVDLVNLAFYGAGGSLSQNDVPTSAQDFAALQGRRVLQVQSPNGNEILLADIENVSGGCD